MIELLDPTTSGLKLHKYIVGHLERLEQISSDCGFLLEIGMGDMNGSTLAFRRGMTRNRKSDRLWISVDNEDRRFVPFEDGDATLGVPRKSLVPDFDFWHFVQGNSGIPSTVDSVLKICGVRKADVIFIDTDHTYEHLTRELSPECWPRVAHSKTVWLFHDTYSLPGGQRHPLTNAAEEFARRIGRVYTDISKESNGLGGIL